jgi:hypothetical protein
MGKLSHQTTPEYCQIIVHTTRRRPIDQHHISNLDAQSQSHLITEYTLLAKLVAGNARSMLRYMKVRTINSHEAVGSTVAFVPVFKNVFKNDLTAANHYVSKAHAVSRLIIH